MTYEVGQKVETLLGVGVVTAIEGNTLIAVNIGKLSIDYVGLVFKESDIKPYGSTHDKLIEIYECYETIYSGKLYLRTEADETLPVEINISRHSKYYYIPDNDRVNLELSRVLTQYLEEME